MTTFQSVVRAEQTSGLPGEPAYEGPFRVQPWTLNSSASGEDNTIGHAFTKIGDGEATVGGAGAFLGILILPKNYALQGVPGDILAPSYVLPDQTVAEILNMGIIFIQSSTAGSVGDGVFFNTTTGEIGLGVAGAGQSQIPNASLILDDIPAPGLAVIQLTS